MAETTRRAKLKIYINSCHASLEYDHTKLFLELGHEVSGLFDIGSDQRPKIPGITDVDAPGEIHESNKTADLSLADMNDPDVIIVHQRADFPERAAKFARLGRPIIVTIFGQGSPDQHRQMAVAMHQHPNIYLQVYSLKAQTIYAELGAPQERVKLIRFGKSRDEFDPTNWTGEDAICFVPCNDIHNRGACGRDIVSMLLKRGVPMVLSGKNTKEIGGRGTLSYDEYKDVLRRARCYLSVGTIPAPYTLTFVEAACSGVPIVANDNGAGVADEGFGVPLIHNADEAEESIRQILSVDWKRDDAHDHSLMLAETKFNGLYVASQWRSLLRQIQRVTESAPGGADPRIAAIQEARAELKDAVNLLDTQVEEVEHQPNKTTIAAIEESRRGAEIPAGREWDMFEGAEALPGITDPVTARHLERMDQRVYRLERILHYHHINGP